MDLNLFKGILLSLVNDERITVWHMGVMFGIIQLAVDEDIDAPIFISRKKVMQRGHINNIVTYHKCIRELQEFGYILYEPSYHPALGSRVHFLKSENILLSSNSNS